MITSPPRSPIRFRGQSFIAFVLVPEAPLDQWLGYLDNLAKRSPGFFSGRPVILDIAALAPAREDLVDLVEKLRERGVRLMGLDGADPKMLGPDLPPPMSGGRPAGEMEVAPEKLTGKVPLSAEARRAAPSSLVVETTVRSGQRIAHLDGDVTVLGSVASGAEIIAGGSIHVYGALRGRAIAGTAGASDARIYCRKLEAEFLAIDGVYRTADDVEDGLRGKPVQAWVANDTLSVAALDF